MAIRVTTKMMQGNSLSNLNTNKTLQEKLNIQMSTLKKITRPSDDPVIAIRSLRLNCTLSKVDQYYEKNTKDAKAWLSLTDKSIDTVSDILTNMRTYMVQGSNGELEVEDRNAIAQNLRQLKEEIYSVGNADYEGRSIFTGYRTGLSLTFQKDTRCQYTITEQLNNTLFDTTTFVKTGDLSEINSGNYTTKTTTEYDVETHEIHRMRLAYSDLDDLAVTNSNLSISYGRDLVVSNSLSQAPAVDINGEQFKFVSETDGTNSLYHLNAATGEYEAVDMTSAINTTINGVTIKSSQDANGIGEISFTAAGMDDVTVQYQKDVNTGTITFDDKSYVNIKVTDSFKSKSDDAYMAAVDNKNAVVYIAETGEVLFGDDIYDSLSKINESQEIRFTYDKTNWQDGDLNPVHYFSCKDENGVVYNSSKLVDTTSATAMQTITYDVGNSQRLQVNSTADEVFTHNIGRDVEELEGLIDQVNEMETILNNVKEMIDSGKYSGTDLTKLEEQKAALEKTDTYLKDKLQKMFEGYQTTFDGYLDQCNIALTKVGSREARQQLIDNRLGEQQTTFETLVSDNEDADLSELAVQLSSVELTYEAALSSISYLMKTTLLNFI